MKMVLRPQIDCLALVELLLVLVKSIVLENVDVFRDPFHHLIVNADAFQLKLKALLVLFQVFLRGRRKMIMKFDCRHLGGCQVPAVVRPSQKSARNQTLNQKASTIDAFDSNDSSSKARVQSKQTNYLVIEWQTFEVLQLLVQLLLADLAVAFEGVDHTEKVDALLAQLFLQTVPVGVVLIAMIDWLRGRRRLRVEHIRAVHRGVHPAAEFPE